MGRRRRRRTCTWQFSLIPSSTYNFLLQYWERLAYYAQAPLLLCVHGPAEGRADGRVQKPEQTLDRPTESPPPSSFHF